MSKDATPVAESVEVAQADRDAAAWSTYSPNILEGFHDETRTVQAFARHRLAAYEAGRAEGVRAAAVLLDALTPILDDIGVPGSDGWTGGYVHVTDLDRLQSAIAAIRALSKEPTK